MRILFLTAYFEPENVASSQMTDTIFEAFAKQGIDMSVYTPTPTRGISDKIRDEYKDRKYDEKLNGKLVIKRFNMIKEGKNPFVKAIRYILCNIVHFIKGLLAKDIDIIIVWSTPPTQGAMASLIKRFRKVPLVYIVQDIFPDSLVNAGLTQRNSLIWKIGRIIEQFSYNNADKIVVISEDFKKNLMEKGVEEDKVEIIYNWVDENVVIPIPRHENYIFDEFNLDRSYFYVTYAGNLGNAQNIEVILETAELLKEMNDIYFVIFGNGSQEDRYKKIAQEKNLVNIKFFPLQPSKKISNVYSLGDISIVTCKAGFGKSAMPSKTWSIMSASTAVLLNFDKDTDLQNIIENNNAGLFSVSGDAQGLKESILKLYYNRELCDSMGKNGRKYIIDNLTKKTGTEKYINLVKSLCKK